MKSLLSIYLFLLCSQLTVGQAIIFSKKSYTSNENISANVIGELIGIESDIKKSSYSASQGDLELGSVSNPGFNRIDFKFGNNITKSYLLAILPPLQATVDDYVIALPDPTGGLDERTVGKMFTYFKLEQEKLLEVTKEAAKKFGSENAVGLILNASFCITTISGQPAVFAICQSLSVANLKKLGFEMMKGYLSDMKAKKYITDNEYHILSTALTFSQIGAILNSNCSLLFKSLKGLADDPNLKIAIGYFEQQCKTAVVIIDKVTIP